MDKFVEYAPIIIVIIGFCVSYKIFVTPKQLSDALDNLKADFDAKYVHKDVFEVEMRNQNNSMNEMKVKIDKIYNKVVGV